ncbi:Amidohydro-rel domain-containing protein [Mycena venus]|uniref:Amidohydro-rel domain-containing protein n=1 Tax=Mycena venus TaxID=2733690 RepID=A0A8H6YWQ9_9AGAR|nr:Amidohydro-rel domain-containing protein [Mycena venus]
MAFSIIDDRDPTITYTGTWNLGGATNEHNGTVSSSINVGNHFSVPFTGTEIGVYGTFDSSSAGVETSYEIDGGPTTTVGLSFGRDISQRLFWQSDALGAGSHTLVVTMVAVNSNFSAGEGTVWFDYFNVTHADSASPSSSKVSHASLIGGVTASVMVFIIAAGLLLLYLRRKREHKNTPPASSITPLPAPVPATMSASGPLLAASYGKRGRPNPNSVESRTVPNTHTTPYYPSGSADNTERIADRKRRQQQFVSSHEAGINGWNAHSGSTPPIQHVDSGVRELTPVGPAELPPVYTAI